MSEIKWRVYEPVIEDMYTPGGDPARRYVFIDRIEFADGEYRGQISGYCSHKEFADLKRRLEGETDADVLAEIEGAFQDDGGD